MPNFLSSSINITRFTVDEAATPSSFFEELRLKLIQFAFQNIDNTSDVFSCGWTNFDDMLDTDFDAITYGKGGYICLGVRMDTRRLPAAVTNKEFEIALREERKSHKFISRERKKEIKEQVSLRLMVRMPPVPEFFQVVWNTSEGVLYFNSTSTAKVDAFVALVKRSLGIDLHEITRSSMAIAQKEDVDVVNAVAETPFASYDMDMSILATPESILGRDFLTFLWWAFETGIVLSDNDNEPICFSVEQHIVVNSGIGTKRETATISGPVATMKEAMTGLTTGKKVSSAFIRLESDESEWGVTLKAGDANFYGLKTPRLAKPSEDDDPDSLILEKIYLIEKAIGMVDALYARFINNRYSEEDWNACVKEIGKWIATRTEA